MMDQQQYEQQYQAYPGDDYYAYEQNAQQNLMRKQI